MKNLSKLFRKILPVERLELCNKESCVCTILGISFFYFGYFIFAAYMFILAIFLCIGWEKFQLSEEDLKSEQSNIDQETLPSSFKLNIFHIIFVIFTLAVAFFFNIFIGVFYFFFITFGFIGAFFKWNIYTIVPKSLYSHFKIFRKDVKTISYHWSNDFFLFKTILILYDTLRHFFETSSARAFEKALYKSFCEFETLSLNKVMPSILKFINKNRIFIFLCFNLCFAGLFGKQFGLVLTGFIKTHSGVFIVIIIAIIFLILIVLFILNFNKIIKKFVDFYFLFLISVFTKETIPHSFISVTVLFGSFFGRQISIYLNLSIIKTFFLTFIFGVLTFLVVYGVFVGFYILAKIYAKSWGNAVFTYLFNKSSPEIQQKFKPKK